MAATFCKALNLILIFIFYCISNGLYNNWDLNKPYSEGYPGFIIINTVKFTSKRLITWFYHTRRAVTKSVKHGAISLAIPGHDSPTDITIFVGIARNLGPFRTTVRLPPQRPIRGNWAGLCINTTITNTTIGYSTRDLPSVPRHADKPSPNIIQLLKDLVIFKIRGKRAGGKRRINSWITNRTTRGIHTPSRHCSEYIFSYPRCGNMNNLISIRRDPLQIQKPCKIINFCPLNARSIRNKSTTIRDFVTDSKIDILALTETWTQGERDDYFARDIRPPNFIFRRIDRKSRGGGVGLLYNVALAFKSKPRYTFKSFEVLDMFTNKPAPLGIVVVYRPPPSNTNRLNCELFFTEFRSYLEQICTDSATLLITGDFNCQVDVHTNSNDRKFMDLINSFGLTQHVKHTAHLSNHTLDLVITRNDDSNIINSISVSDIGFSDHFAVKAKICLEKPLRQRREITYRLLKSINYKDLRHEIEQSTLLCDTASFSTVADAVDMYESSLKLILDSFAPTKKKLITLRPPCLWFTEELKHLKTTKRKLEVISGLIPICEACLGIL